MYNALIVDDERIIRNGLLKMPLWRELEIAVQEASNGLEAMERLAQHPFDILITDIRMPGVNGLSLIEEAVKRYPHIQIAVLSGHTQFEYAQAALRFGVQDYLLKPVSPQEFRQMIEKMLTRLQQQAQARETQKQKRKKMDVVRRRAEEAALEQFLLGTVLAEEFLPAWLREDLPVELILILPGDSELTLTPAEHVTPILNALGRVFDRTDPAPGPLAVFPFMGNILLVGLAHPSIFGEVAICLQSLDQQDFDDPPVSAVCRVKPQGARSLPKLYQQALALADYRFYKEGLAVLDATIPLGGRCPPYAAVLEALQGKNLPAAQQALDVFFQETCLALPPPQETKETCAKIYQEIAQQLGEGERTLGTHISEMMASGSWRRFDILQQLLVQLLNHIETAWATQKLQSYSPIVRKAILYVREHLADEALSQGVLASEVLFINSDYFGRMFRKETGLSFTQYLLDLRMQKAQSLMEQHPDMRVGKVCEQVGYGENPQYFSQIFRQCFGCAPSEYKKLIELRMKR